MQFTNPDPQRVRLLLTGITGFLGTHIANLLLKNKQHSKIKIRAVTHKHENVQKYKSLFPVHEVEWVVADLLDRDQTLEAMQGCTHIIHCASIAKPKLVHMWFEQPDKVKNQGIEKMTSSLENILAGCTKHKIEKLVVTGSYTNLCGNGI